MRRLGLISLALTLAGACGDDGGPAATACVATTDCLAGQRCINGVCVVRADAATAPDGATDAASDTDAATAPDASASCESGADCAPGSFCQAAACDGPGECVARPTSCPDEDAPVCGCDRATYPNSCEAASAGVRVASDGPCACETADDCAAGSYCAGASCVGPGECAPRPDACTRDIDPVCGCDGTTYNNACLAASAGVRVATTGACPPSGCTDNAECGLSAYCDGTTCRGVGSCTPRPRRCPPELDPVCGCNGVVYSNPCEAALAGVRLDPDPRGPCVAL